MWPGHIRAYAFLPVSLLQHGERSSNCPAGGTKVSPQSNKLNGGFLAAGYDHTPPAQHFTGAWRGGKVPPPRKKKSAS